MKYNAENKPLACMLTNSTCYKATKPMVIHGVLFHSTGANNPNLKRYVQPLSSDSNYKQMISLLGENTSRNDWNHITRQAGVNAWIGKLADGTVTTVQAMPWNYRPWGCGSGSKGSLNDGWIQFEICEDNLNDKAYFEAVYKEAIELTAYLCKLYKLNPNGNMVFKGVKVPVLTCHADACKLGFASNHGDVNHWFSKYGKSMQTVRDDVAKLLSGGVSSTPKATSTPAPAKTSTMYRIRKTWTDAKSQIGAYTNLENAKKSCKAGYSVFDSEGKVVYTVSNKKTVEEVAKEVWKGLWGSGEERKKKLTAAGYDYNAVQAMIKKLYY